MSLLQIFSPHIPALLGYHAQAIDIISYIQRKDLLILTNERTLESLEPGEMHV